MILYHMALVHSLIHPQGPHDVTRLWLCHPECQWPACRDLKVELKMISIQKLGPWMVAKRRVSQSEEVDVFFGGATCLSLYQEVVEKIQLSAPLLIAAQIRFDTPLHQEFGSATGFFVFFWQSQFGLEVPMSGVHCASHFQAGWSSRLRLKKWSESGPIFLAFKSPWMVRHLGHFVASTPGIWLKSDLLHHPDWFFLGLRAAAQTVPVALHYGPAVFKAGWKTSCRQSKKKIQEISRIWTSGIPRFMVDSDSIWQHMDAYGSIWMIVIHGVVILPLENVVATVPMDHIFSERYNISIPSLENPLLKIGHPKIQNS